MNKKAEELLLKSTSIVYAFDEEGSYEQATCFFIKNTIKGKEQHYLVTNKHVLENKIKIDLYLDVYHKNTESYTHHKKITLALNDAVRFHDTYDLAVLNIDCIDKLNTEDDTYSYKALDMKIIPKDYSIFSNFQTIYLIGYPSGISDTCSNLPVTRRGIISTPLTNNFKGKAEFLIDIPFLNGSSGSPIFAKVKGEVYLVGIEYSKILEKVTLDKYPNRLYHSKKHTFEMETGLGIAVKSEELLKIM